MKEWYAEYDELTGLWCVFNTEEGKAYASYADKEQADEAARQMNRFEGRL